MLVRIQFSRMIMFETNLYLYLQKNLTEGDI
jgi:hypothetical protein